MKFKQIFESKIITVKDEDGNLFKIIMNFIDKQYYYLIKENNLSLKIHFKGEEYILYIKIENRNTYSEQDKTIYINKNEIINGKNNILKILSHEVQHFIQKIAQEEKDGPNIKQNRKTGKKENNIDKLKDYSDEKFKKYAKDYDTSKLGAYHKLHDILPFEQDASLASVLYAIKNDSDFDWYYLKLDKSINFSTLTYKKFIQKAFSFGINNNELKKFKTSYSEYVESKLNGLKKEIEKDFAMNKKYGTDINKSLSAEYENYMQLAKVFLNK